MLNLLHIINKIIEIYFLDGWILQMIGCSSLTVVEHGQALAETLIDIPKFKKFGIRQNMFIMLILSNLWIHCDRNDC